MGGGGGGRAFNHHSRNGGRGICQQKLPAGLGICQIFSNSRGLPGGLPGGKLAAGIDSHIRVMAKYTITVIRLYKKKHGSLQQFLCGKVGREQDSQAKVYKFKPWTGQQVSSFSKEKIF